MDYVVVAGGEDFTLALKGGSYVTNVCDEICGNNITGDIETCDDGNLIDGDGCSSSCQIETACGDGTIDSNEECDDSNSLDSDGCSQECKLEISSEFVCYSSQNFENEYSTPESVKNSNGTVCE